MIRKRKSVALLIETSNAYARGILEGIVEYQRSRDHWSIYLPELDRGANPPSWFRGWKGDGVIARIETETIATLVTSLNVPTIDVSAARRVRKIPWVETDDSRVADLAYEHLREKGFRHFAFCGPKGFNWSKWREAFFRKRCVKDRLPCSTYWTSAPRQSAVDGDEVDANALAPPSKMLLEEWLRSLPQPTGLFCAYDIQAQIILDQCRNLDIQVPEQIAVVGVDNDSILCNLSHPSLSSVIPDARGAGFYAAELLDDWMNQNHSKKTPPASMFAKSSKLLEPLGVEQRQSTDITAVTNPNVAAAVKFIRDHACDGIDVSHLLQHVPLSRRKLEYQFVEEIGCTPHAMISRIRLARVSHLLRESELSLEEIANRCGFEHPEYMSVVFKRMTGLSPGQFRKSNLG